MKIIDNKSNILFVGDLMFGDMPINFGNGFDSKHSYNKYARIFDGVKAHLDDSAYVIGNFEAVIKPRPNELSINSWVMCCDEYICRQLSDSNFNIINIANNHVTDYGKKYFKYTCECLSEAGIKIIGLKDKPYEIIELNNKKIAIIGVSYVKSSLMLMDIPYFYNPSIRDVSDLIENIGVVDYIIAYVHWGYEYIDLPDQNQIKIAADLKNSGVDLIIGHHSHITQEPELFCGVPICFSLGNFISDYWQKRLRKSSILCVSFADKIKLSQVRCYIDDNGTPHAIQKEELVLENFDRILASNFRVNLERWRMRVEIILHFIKNIANIKDKSGVIKWVCRRIIYITRNMYKEFKNPEIIYEKYKH
jgi:DNA-directed RNA polymerase subunit N (RpoN/RPB10)